MREHTSRISRSVFLISIILLVMSDPGMAQDKGQSRRQLEQTSKGEGV